MENPELVWRSGMVRCELLIRNWGLAPPMKPDLSTVNFVVVSISKSGVRNVCAAAFAVLLVISQVVI